MDSPNKRILEKWEPEEFARLVSRRLELDLDDSPHSTVIPICVFFGVLGV